MTDLKVGHYMGRVAWRGRVADWAVAWVVVRWVMGWGIGGSSWGDRMTDLKVGHYMGLAWRGRVVARWGRFRERGFGLRRSGWLCARRRSRRR